MGWKPSLDDADNGAIASLAHAGAHGGAADVAAALDVPDFIVRGVYDERGRAVTAAAWFTEPLAPDKSRIEFEPSGHRPGFEESERFAQVMEELLAGTCPGNEVRR